MTAKQQASVENSQFNALYQLNILDTEPEEAFDNLVTLAGTICQTRMAFITFLDKDRLWFKAKYGTTSSQIESGCTFCEIVIANQTPLHVANTLADPEYCNHSHVLGAPNILTYAGFPIKLFGETIVGTLCVLDNQHCKELSQFQLDTLAIIAKQISSLLELRIKLNTSQSILETYFNSTSEAVCIVGMDNYNILSFNNFFAATIFKIYAQKMAIGDTIGQYFKDLNFDNFVLNFKKCIDLNEIVVVERLVIFNKFSAWYSMQYIPLKNNLNQIFAVAFTAKNVGEEKKHKDLLQETNDLALVGGWEIDLVTNNTIWTNVTKQIFEVADAFEPKMQAFLPFCYNEISAELLNNAFENLTKNGTSFNVELPILTAKSNQKWVKISGKAQFETNKCVRLLGAICDITQEKELRDIHKRSEEKFKAMIHNISDIVTLIDQNGIIQYQSSSVKQTMGYSENELEGRNIFELIHPDDKAQVFENLKIAFQTTGNTPAVEFRLLDKTGNYFYIEANGNNQLNNPLINALIINSRDITSRKKAELELNASFGLLNEQNKRLQNFSYIVSHNIRSHASNILGIVDYISAPDVSVDERNEMLHHLPKVAHALNSTLNDLNELLNIQKNVNLLTHSLNLRSYALEALDVLAVTAKEKNVDVSINISETIYINHNKAYLESILLNLLSNAIRYSDAKKPYQKIAINAFIKNDKTILEVIDNGVGINMSRNANSLFGLYKTFHGNKDARGYGLFITKNQIEALGGNIVVESELHVGSKFIVTFQNNN